MNYLHKFLILLAVDHNGVEIETFSNDIFMPEHYITIATHFVAEPSISSLEFDSHENRTDV